MNGEPVDQCIFCKIIQGNIPAHIVQETATTLAFLDSLPVAPYHTLVIPKAHYADIFDTPADVFGDLMAAVHQVCRLYETKLGIHDVQIINNSGKQTQQTVFHLHFHIVPRRNGDGIFVPMNRYPELIERYDELLARLK